MDFKNIEAKIKKWVLQLQALPEIHKKIILWAVVVLIALPMLFFWIKGTMERMVNIGPIDLNLPAINVESSPVGEILTETTADWQTYINEEYGFEMKIPQDWIVKNSEYGVIFTTQELQDAAAENSLNCRQGKECSAEFLSETARFEYIKTGADVYTSDDLVNGISQIQHNGINWSRYQPPGFWSNIHFRAINNGKGYDFVTNYDNYEGTLIQALSTFKFIK